MTSSLLFSYYLCDYIAFTLWQF